MTITEIEEYIHQLFIINGMQPYKVEFHYTNRYAGACNVKERVIEISLIAIEGLSNERCKNLCLHEFCHAFSYYLFGTVAHDKYWSGTCDLMNCPDDLYI